MSPQAPSYTGVTPSPAPSDGDLFDISLPSHQIIIATETLCIGLTTLVVAARIYTKCAVLRRRDYDDYVCICAWVGMLVYAADGITAGRYGMGMHIWQVPPSTSTSLAKLGYRGFIYNPIIFLAKLSILVLFTRIFEVRTRFVLGVKALAMLLFVYYTAITFVMAFACRPVRKFWLPETRGTCLDKDGMFISNSVVGMTTDVLILGLPVLGMWGLRMSRWKKVGACCVLAAGGLACFASVYRLYYTVATLHDNDKTYNRLHVLIANSWEIAITIICGCLPCLPALFRHLFGKSESDRHKATSKKESDAQPVMGGKQSSSVSLIPRMSI